MFEPSRRFRSLFAGVVLTVLAGCGQSAIVSSELPVRRVVVYRNGVAYFEREGRVSKDEVRFKMREDEVSDFLGTLAIVEAGGNSVRSATFPIKLEDGEDDPKPRAKMSAAEKRGLKDVVLRLDGEKHDLKVGYVAPSPVWRPSYRLLVDAQGKASLQAWGVVENLSGEDWKDVQLTLVAGAPLAFESQLGTPTIPRRPLVTDNGEVIDAVPLGETSLRERAAAPPPPPVMPSVEAAPSEREEMLADMPEADDEDEPAKSAKDRARSAPKRAAKPGDKKAAAAADGYGYGYGTGGGGAPAPVVQESLSAPRNLSTLAAVAQEGGTTRYALPTSVTIPYKSATMVLLAAPSVPGEVGFLFSRDPGVPDASSHPFRVARFANSTKGILERGPIAVFESASFLGQGMLESLPVGATATVPFALERGIAIRSEVKYEELGERIAKIENGDLTVERDSVQLTHYFIDNGLDEIAKVMVKHPRRHGARLEKPPQGTEDNAASGTALVPIKVNPRQNAVLRVDERSAHAMVVDWASPIADSAFKNYKASARADREVVKKLEAAWLLRAEMVKARDARATIAAEERDLQMQTEETRRNLRAIEKNQAAAQLRAELTKRLASFSARLDVLTREAIVLDTKATEQSIRFRDAVRAIRVMPAS